MAPVTAPAVLVVDDQPALRDGLVRLLRASSLAWRGVYAAASRAEAVDLLERYGPELVLLDMDLAGDDGLALFAQLHHHERVLVLTTHDDAESYRRAIALGAAGFARKSDPPARLLQQIAALTRH